MRPFCHQRELSVIFTFLPFRRAVIAELSLAYVVYCEPSRRTISENQCALAGSLIFFTFASRNLGSRRKALSQFETLCFARLQGNRHGLLTKTNLASQRHWRDIMQVAFHTSC